MRLLTSGWSHAVVSIDRFAKPTITILTNATTINWTEWTSLCDTRLLVCERKNGFVFLQNRRLILKANTPIGRAILLLRVYQKPMSGCSHLTVELPIILMKKIESMVLKIGMSTTVISFRKNSHWILMAVGEVMYRNKMLCRCPAQRPGAMKIAYQRCVIC